MLSLPEIAISACRDVISIRGSYLCMQRCYRYQRYLSLHAEIALKHVEGKHGILSEEKLGVLFQ